MEKTRHYIPKGTGEFTIEAETMQKIGYLDEENNAIYELKDGRIIKVNDEGTIKISRDGGVNFQSKKFEEGVLVNLNENAQETGIGKMRKYVTKSGGSVLKVGVVGTSAAAGTALAAVALTPVGLPFLAPGAGAVAGVVAGKAYDATVYGVGEGIRAIQRQLTPRDHHRDRDLSLYTSQASGMEYMIPTEIDAQDVAFAASYYE